MREHALAAGEFSRAASETTSIEALRTLKLLEEHHRRLSELLKIPLEQQPAQTPSTAEGDGQAAGDKAVAAGGGGTVVEAGKQGQQPAAGAGKQQERPSPQQPQPQAQTVRGGGAVTAAIPSLPQQRSFKAGAGRDLSSSIASNLANARGIRTMRPGAALTPSMSPDQAPGNVEQQHHGVRGRDVSRARMQSLLENDSNAGKPGWVPPMYGGPGGPARQQQQESSGRLADAATGPASNEDGFSRFYSTVGSLLKIPVTLAFAGLPLIREESSTAESSQQALPKQGPPEAQQQRRTRIKAEPSSVSASAEPDISRIYSKAALRAVSHDGRSLGGPTESFYVVPTSGQTVSYANILSFAEKEKRRKDNASAAGTAADADEDDFVDARETQEPPLSPGFRKRLGRSRTDKELRNVIEELYMENKSLKEIIDKLSGRLQAFEANAQFSSAALAESMRLMRPGSPLLSVAAAQGGLYPGQQQARQGKDHGVSAGDDALRQRNRELEERLAESQRRLEAAEAEMARMHKNLVKYRDRWDKLKTAAMQRREQQAGSGEPAEDSKSPEL